MVKPTTTMGPLLRLQLLLLPHIQPPGTRMVSLLPNHRERNPITLRGRTRTRTPTPIPTPTPKTTSPTPMNAALRVPRDTRTETRSLSSRPTNPPPVRTDRDGPRNPSCYDPRASILCASRTTWVAALTKRYPSGVLDTVSKTTISLILSPS